MTVGTIKVALVLPVFNRREITLQGLRSLSRIEATNIEIRIFVVDDASTDGTADAIRQQFPDVCVIVGSGSLHYAAGTNRGIEAALEWRPDFIATMNDDAVFGRDFLVRLIETARANPRSVVGSLLLLWDEPHRVFQVGQRWQTLAGGWVIPENLTLRTMGDEPFEVECIVGNCVLFPAEAIGECGLMDERRFPHGWGDAQYLMRMRRRGWRLVVDPRSRVWCEPNTYPPALHSLPLMKMLNVLFVNERHPLNLRRQFVARWESAPSHASAAAAFLIYAGLLAGKAIKYSFQRHS